jgi:hypothetical protein
MNIREIYPWGENPWGESSVQRCRRIKTPGQKERKDISPRSGQDSMGQHESKARHPDGYVFLNVESEKPERKRREEATATTELYSGDNQSQAHPLLRQNVGT